jgi:hypothetical protein
MSAFVVSTTHIDAMLRAVVGAQFPVTWRGTHGTCLDADEGADEWRKLDDTCLDDVGRMLLAECLTSVRYRYPDCSPEELPGPCPTPRAGEYRHRYAARIPTAVEALKLIDCYEYQSCEHPGWKDSEAKRFCDAARRNLVSLLPGYDTAPWEWRDTHDDRPPSSETSYAPVRRGSPRR